MIQDDCSWPLFRSPAWFSVCLPSWMEAWYRSTIDSDTDSALT
jgi:hypothetical protein